jgi:hypothetical protein
VHTGATGYDDYPKTGHLSEQQSRSHWSDMIRYTISDTTEVKDHFFGSVVLMSSSREDFVVAYMYRYMLVSTSLMNVIINDQSCVPVMFRLPGVERH